MFINEECAECKEPIPTLELRKKPTYWGCLKCGKNNYKHIMKIRLTMVKNGEKIVLIKQTVTPDNNSSIMRNEGECWTHEVKDGYGKVLHPKHKKQS